MQADKAKLGYVITSNRDSDSWYTPEKYIESVRYVLGSIDIDPFSSKEANLVVKASFYYIKEHDALSFDWARLDNCFANPPYSKGLMQRCVDKLLGQRNNGCCKNTILLCNASTDTKWFQKLLNNSTSMCLTSGRISFENIDGKSVSGNTKGQAFFLLTNDNSIVSRFHEEFSKYGFVVDLKEDKCK